MNRLHDVIIVGAGPAGSTAAAALAQQGWDVLLLERDEFPRHKVCGEFLSPEAQATLRALKVHEAVAAMAPVPLTAATVTTQRSQTVQMSLPGQAWGVSRFALDAALAGAAQRHGATLCTGVTVQSFTRIGDHYVVHGQTRQPGAARSQPGTVAGRTLLIACGRHSATALPPHPIPHKRPLAVGIKCHYVDIAMPAQVELFFFPGGYAGINPIEGGRANLCLLLSYAAFRRAGQSVPATLAAICAWNPALGRRLLGGHVLTETITTVAPVDTGNPAAPWADVACLGDAAVMLPPLCGDGMAMALRSAELCAPLADAFLRGQLTLDAWAAAYQTRWHDEFDQRVRTGRRLQRLLSLPLLADALVGLGRLAPPLATYFVNATRGSLPDSFASHPRRMADEIAHS
ncbi:MAG: FAD-dependent oxidoreductase [Caldilineaceae bacterium]